MRAKRTSTAAGPLRRTAPAAPAASSASTPPLQAAASGPSGLPWLQLVGMVWPLLPATWRQRVSPATLNMVLNVGLPLAEVQPLQALLAVASEEGLDIPRLQYADLDVMADGSS